MVYGIGSTTFMGLKNTGDPIVLHCVVKKMVCDGDGAEEKWAGNTRSWGVGTGHLRLRLIRALSHLDACACHCAFPWASGFPTVRSPVLVWFAYWIQMFRVLGPGHLHSLDPFFARYRVKGHGCAASQAVSELSCHFEAT